MFSSSKLIKNISFVLAVLVISWVLSRSVLAWTEPSTPPPGGNVDAPVNTGVTSQIKSGNLQVNALSIAASGNALLVPNGNVGIGTTTPSQKLEVAGKIKIGSDATAPSAGTIRWSGTDFEGYDGTVWKSLTSGGGGSSVPAGTAANQTLYWNGSAWTLNSTFVTNGSHIGIGTGPATEMLDIHDTTGTGAASIGDSNVSAPGRYAVALGAGGHASGISSFKVGGPIDINGNYSVGINLSNVAGNTIANPNTMAIMGGNVGIGTTNPVAKLDVRGNVRIGSGVVSSNKALCWTPSGTIGYCSSQPDITGSCTCNTIN